MAAMNSARRAHNALSENDKVEIVRRRALVHHWADIARDLKHDESTIRSFHAKLQRNGCLQKLMGGPKPSVLVTVVIDLTRVEPRSTIRDIAERLDLSREAVPMTRHRHGFRYYDSIPVPSVSESAKQARITFCLSQLRSEDARPIVFTDESSVEQDLRLGGIWRRRGELIPEAVYEANAHPISVVVWGTICTGARLPF
jgi:hypothetical protein